jgi:DnaA family protein
MSQNVQRQLTLNVTLRDDATLANFLDRDATQPLIHALTTQLDEAGEPCIFVHGGADSGRTHLLQASCHLSDIQALYLPMLELQGYDPSEVLAGVESLDLVCIDDLHLVLGNDDWEQALFHFFNRARDSGCRLLISADRAPRFLPVALADLQSRLSWGIVYELPVFTDEDRLDLLIMRASGRGLVLSPELANFIISRAPRGLSQLLDILNKLDAASLAEKRSLSIPFAKAVLDW